MKPRKNFPGIHGFENFPEGKLLNQRVDFDGPVGIAYERCIGYTKPAHTHDRITLTFPRGSSHSFIKVFPEDKTFKLTSSSVHVMAKDHEHEQGSFSSIYDVFAIFVTLEHFEVHLKKAGAQPSEIQSFFTTTQSFQRSAVLTEIVDRYFVGRVLEKTPSPAGLAHLESLLLTEVFASGSKNVSRVTKPTSLTEPASAEAPTDETALIRALEFIESHLFEKLDVAALVRTSRTSQATLFRLFKRELDVSPLEYVRNRRLDEATSLLKGGTYQVSDVALLVGYEDLSSFSKAFKARFGEAPSFALPKKKSAKVR